MADKLTGQVAVVTGAGRGIGAAIAKAFAGEGASIAICGRNNERLQTTADLIRQLGVAVLAETADVTDETSVRGFFSAIVNRFGKVDLLVNNAGAFDGGPLESITLGEWNNVIDVCLTGTFLSTREAFRLMKDRGGGRILNIGSISGKRTREESAPYTAAKFGVWGLTQATALDGRTHGIICSCLNPGNVMVERRENTGLAADVEPMIGVDSIAAAALAMVTLPPDVNFLEATVLPRDQLFLGRG